VRAFQGNICGVPGEGPTTKSPKTMLDFYSASSTSAAASKDHASVPAPTAPAPTAASQAFQNSVPRAWQSIGSVDPLRSTVLHTPSTVVPQSPVLSSRLVLLPMSIRVRTCTLGWVGSVLVTG
jgi:hypothetical protein